LPPLLAIISRTQYDKKQLYLQHMLTRRRNSPFFQVKQFKCGVKARVTGVKETLGPCFSNFLPEIIFVNQCDEQPLAIGFV